MLNLVKQKEFYSFEYISDFENFKEKLPEKKSFMGFFTGKEISDKDYEHIYLKKCI